MLHYQCWKHCKHYNTARNQSPHFNNVMCNITSWLQLIHVLYVCAYLGQVQQLQSWWELSAQSPSLLLSVENNIIYTAHSNTHYLLPSNQPWSILIHCRSHQWVGFPLATPCMQARGKVVAMVTYYHNYIILLRNSYSLISYKMSRLSNYLCSCVWPVKDATIQPRY